MTSRDNPWHAAAPTGTIGSEGANAEDKKKAETQNVSTAAADF